MKRVRMKNLPYRVQLFILMLLAALIPLSIMGVFSYISYTSDLEEKLDITAQSMVNQTRDRVDSVLTSAREYYVDVHKNSDVSWLLDATESPMTQHAEVNSAIHVFRGNLGLYEYVSDYSFISRKGDFVISNNGIQRYSTTDNYDEVERLISADENRIYIRLKWHNNAAAAAGARTIVPRGTVNLKGYLLILRLPANGIEVEQALIVNMDMTHLTRLLTWNLEDYNVVVLDHEGQLFAASDDAMTAYCTANFASLTPSNMPASIKVDDGTRYRIAMAPSNSNGLIFIVGYNQDMVTEVADRILALFAVLGVAVVIIILISLAGSRWIGKPISRLADFFSISESKSSNDLEQIERGVEKLVGSHNMMERMVDDQRKLLMQVFMTRLYRGEAGTRQAESYVSQLRLPELAYYRVAVCRLSTGNDSDPDSVDDNAIRILFLEHLPKAIQDMLYVPPVNDGNAIVMMLAGDDLESFDSRTEKLFEAVRVYAQDTLSVMPYMGVSVPVDRLHRVRGAFLEAIESLKTDFVDEAGGTTSGVRYYADIRAEQVVSTAQNESYAQDVRLAIDQCNRKKAARCTAEFIRALPGWVVARHETTMQIHRFLTAILSVLSEAGLSLDEVFEGTDQSLFLQASNLYDAEKLEAFFLHTVIEPCIAALEAFREGNTPMRRIRELVHESKGNITVAECAEQLGYHTSHVWRIIKAFTGMSFSDYVAQEKLRFAEQMLLETDLSIAEIAESLNYTNAQNFIRFFNKHHGTTPGKYRQAARKHNGADV